MALTSIRFVLFAALLLAVYYAVPQRQRWWVLLAGSLCFYALAGLKNVIYILITAASTYLAARGMQTLSARQKARFKADPPLSKEEKAACKAKTASRRRAILVLTLVLNFGILCGFKYAAFALAQVSGLVRLFGGEGFSGALHLIVPLGISFYTFQTMGYLIDVYWKRSRHSRISPSSCCSFPSSRRSRRGRSAITRSFRSSFLRPIHTPTRHSKAAASA